jgi:hypothetical protein
VQETGLAAPDVVEYRIARQVAQVTDGRGVLMETGISRMRQRSVRRLLWVAMPVVALAALALPASALALNDDVQLAEPLALNTFVPANNTGATTQPGEPLTLQDGTYCDENPAGATSITEHYTGATLWWRVAGTGGQIDLSTEGSALDTVLAVYNSSDTPTRTNLLCSDDFAFPSDLTSRVSFISVLGQSYLIQVGSAQACNRPAADPTCSAVASPNPPATGNFQLIARGTAPPPPPTTPPPPPPAPIVIAPPPPPPPPPLKRFEADASMAATRSGTGLNVLSLRVTGPAGARVRVTCSRGCTPFSGTIKRVSGRARALTVGTIRNRLLRNGTQVRVFITRPGSIGTFIRYTVRRGNLIKSGRRCLAPGSSVPRACA